MPANKLAKINSTSYQTPQHHSTSSTANVRSGAKPVKRIDNQTDKKGRITKAIVGLRPQRRGAMAPAYSLAGPWGGRGSTMTCFSSWVQAGAGPRATPQLPFWPLDRSEGQSRMGEVNGDRTSVPEWLPHDPS